MEEEEGEDGLEPVALVLARDVSVQSRIYVWWSTVVN